MVRINFSTTTAFERVFRLLPDSATLVNGKLALAGISLTALAETYGTPLYVYDEQTLRANARAVRDAFLPLGARISYASKACDIIAVLRVLRSEGLDLDVVSEGQIAAGLRAGFNSRQMILHGNSKSSAELDTATGHPLHAIVVDNVEELQNLSSRTASNDAPNSVWLRIAFDFKAATHPHLQTSGHRSKFGFYHGSDEERCAIELLAASPGLVLRGLHTHLGSQISDATWYHKASQKLFALGNALRSQGHPVTELGIGGGWAVPYRDGEASLLPGEVATRIQDLYAGNVFTPAVEPGRFVVARAAIALYRVTSVKSAPAGRIVAIDGGMGDNVRPALYGARYDALLPERPEAKVTGPVDIVGRYCESGDFLVRDVLLPDVRAGDLVMLPVSGAYHLALASAYNLVPPPTAVMVAYGQARTILRRASVEDLLQRHSD